MRRIAVLLFALFVLGGCESPRPPARELANAFRVTPEFALGRGLPPASFALSYPNKLEVNQARIAPKGKERFNAYYIRLRKRGPDKKMLEELTVGRLPGMGKGFLLQAAARSFEKQLKRTYKQTQIRLNLRRSFRGMTAFQIHAEINAAGDEPGPEGRYRLLVILLPAPDGPNGVQIAARAGWDSPIKSFADFERKGMIGAVLGTFRFE